ncbi:P6 [Sclerotinia sclerotiorum mycoreovirus 4]|uniref:P6 n=1 Tax=Sclerotinia sclerotiorum mycoreovirus 4 TaxID=1840528 RepID=UPI0007C1D91E|nr:P6 [Sclerotinia sclerotiorum mycoreovirus 4]ANC52164.1 P6 [Sclerotinia sclerotiorum mycoreovirus 4]
MNALADPNSSNGPPLSDVTFPLIRRSFSHATYTTLPLPTDIYQMLRCVEVYLERLYTADVTRYVDVVSNYRKTSVARAVPHIFVVNSMEKFSTSYSTLLSKSPHDYVSSDVTVVSNPTSQDIIRSIRAHKHVVCNVVPIGDFSDAILMPNASISDCVKYLRRNFHALLRRLSFGHGCYSCSNVLQLSLPPWLSVLASGWQRFKPTGSDTDFAQFYLTPARPQLSVINSISDLSDFIINRLQANVDVVYFDDVLTTDGRTIAEKIRATGAQFNVARDMTHFNIIKQRYLEQTSIRRRRQHKKELHASDRKQNIVARVFPPVYLVDLSVSIRAWNSAMPTQQQRRLSRVYSDLVNLSKRPLTVLHMIAWNGPSVVSTDSDVWQDFTEWLFCVVQNVDESMARLLTAIPYMSVEIKISGSGFGTWIDLRNWTEGFSLSKILVGRTYMVGKKNSGKGMIGKLIWRLGVPVVDSDDYGRVLLIAENTGVSLEDAVRCHFSRSYADRDCAPTLFETIMDDIVTRLSIKRYSIPEVDHPALMMFGHAYDELTKKYKYADFERMVRSFISHHGVRAPDGSLLKVDDRFVFSTHCSEEATQVLGANYMFQLSTAIDSYVGVLLRGQHDNSISELMLAVYYDRIHVNIFDLVPTGVVCTVLRTGLARLVPKA